MPLTTTCIGAYPKPDFVELPDWFNHPDGPDTAAPTALWEKAMATLGPAAEDIIGRGVAQAIADQLECGIDIPTDGEIARENYITLPLQALTGFRFRSVDAPGGSRRQLRSRAADDQWSGLGARSIPARRLAARPG